jgi:hypothetical protein
MGTPANLVNGADTTKYQSFSGAYGHRLAVAEDGEAGIPERVIQALWFDQQFESDGLCTHKGDALRILSPGWWNHGEGPDFKDAQIELRGEVRQGDIEVHLDHASWKGHGHHIDSRYDDVLLVAVLQPKPPKELPVTSDGRAIPCLLLSNFLLEDIESLTRSTPLEPLDEDATLARGFCASVAQAYGRERITSFVNQAGEWRLLNKARLLRERIDRAGPDQALYEAIMTACGYSRYKQHFRVVSQQLPYDRVRQLAQRDPLLVEAACLHLAGLLPNQLPTGTSAVPHFARLCGLRRDDLSGLRQLPLVWKRVAVRPNNYPERRMAGAARFFARVSQTGLAATLDNIWKTDEKPIARRRMFENLFPRPMGFWADHCSWTGKKLARPTALIGPSRVRSMIGNVFIPYGLALARQARDLELEHRVYRFFNAFPKEDENRIVSLMVPRVFGDTPPKRIDFRAQQGLLQIYQDYCEANPSCRNCRMIPFLDDRGEARKLFERNP